MSSSRALRRLGQLAAALFLACGLLLSLAAHPLGRAAAGSHLCAAAVTAAGMLLALAWLGIGVLLLGLLPSAPPHA